MSNKNNEHYKITNTSSNKNKNLLWVGVAVVFLIVLANKKSVSNDSSLESIVPTGHISSNTCVSKVHDVTQYERTRLKVSSQANSAVHVTYRNNSGRVHKFRCFGASGDVQIFAEGAGMWMAM
ncbi:protein of unknown function [Shewanella benthica]|uniref:Uncharacterized protein n=1 Tax=Shewanella benthica TaxID=43661 RepID=A0A330M1Q2_9GAMM|nr:hypothetical protein [Shewanella benthica]SQH76466.1 protein of unknown function [Shewanella benthica]